MFVLNKKTHNSEKLLLNSFINVCGTKLFKTKIKTCIFPVLYFVQYLF